MRRVLLATILVAACARTAPATDGTVVLPPTPASTAASSALPPPRPAASPRDLAIVGGDLVDLGTLTPLHALTTDLAFSRAVANDTAYLYARGATGTELRAYDVTTGSPRWSRPVGSCWAIAASRLGVLCGDESGAHFYDATSGDVKAAGAATAVSSITALAGRVLVLHADKSLESLDESGVVAGTTTVPAIPDRAFFGSGLVPVGAVACGAQRSNAATLTFCVDASPKVVWQRSVAVPGGLLAQAEDGALVVASDTWTKAIASEVVRPRDGATLLHVPSVRLGAALTTGGVLDGALSVGPDVVLYDASGGVKWTWHQPASGLRAVRIGPSIAIALYNPIATGTELVALDAISGTLAWTASVDQLPIAHSKYSNEVDLRLTPSGLLLLGHESSQDYAQRFDPATGVRAASVLRKR